MARSSLTALTFVLAARLALRAGGAGRTSLHAGRLGLDARRQRGGRRARRRRRPVHRHGRRAEGAVDPALAHREAGRRRRSRARAAGGLLAGRLHEGRRVALRLVRGESHAAARRLPARGPRPATDAVGDGDAAVGDRGGAAVARRRPVPDRRFATAARSAARGAHRHRARGILAVRRQRGRHRRRVVVPVAHARERDRVGGRQRVDCRRSRRRPRSAITTCGRSSTSAARTARAASPRSPTR